MIAKFSGHHPMAERADKLKWLYSGARVVIYRVSAMFLLCSSFVIKPQYAGALHPSVDQVPRPTECHLFSAANSISGVKPKICFGGTKMFLGRYKTLILMFNSHSGVIFTP